MLIIFLYVVVFFVIGFGLGECVILCCLLVVGVVVFMIFDLDVVVFWLGIFYGDNFGYCGVMYLIFFVICVVLVVMMFFW